MKTLIISGINLFSGGTLSIYKECLNSIINDGRLNDYKVIAYVHKRELFSEFDDRITFIELPKSREGYLKRMYYEYVYFYKESLKYKPDVWFSIHDMTPRVRAGKLFVYCHSPLPFFKRDKRTWRENTKVCVMSLLYKYIYRINIRRNDAVIVQQNWMKQEFERMFHIKNVIVARPDVVIPSFRAEESKNGITSFVYPSFPRLFKNFQVICEAVKLLNGIGVNTEVYLTIDGTENAYSKSILDKYKDVAGIHFTGILPKDKVVSLYNKCDGLLFPSVLETWGLPITEFETTGKPVIAADLPYAHETVGDYDNAAFFEPEDYATLARLMREVCEGRRLYEHKGVNTGADKPLRGWTELMNHILT